MCVFLQTLYAILLVPTCSASPLLNVVIMNVVLKCFCLVFVIWLLSHWFHHHHGRHVDFVSMELFKNSMKSSTRNPKYCAIFHNNKDRMGFITQNYKLKFKDHCFIMLITELNWTVCQHSFATTKVQLYNCSTKKRKQKACKHNFGTNLLCTCLYLLCWWMRKNIIQRNHKYITVV